MPTVIPFHAAVVSDPAFVGSPAEKPESFDVYTQWIETDFDNQITPYAGDRPDAPEPDERNKVTVEVGGRRLEVVLPGGSRRGRRQQPAVRKKPKRAAGKKAGAAASGDSVASPMQGTIVKVTVSEGDSVEEGDTIVVLEAMKMEQPLKAHKAGTVTRPQGRGRLRRHQRRGHLRDQGRGVALQRSRSSETSAPWWITSRWMCSTSSESGWSANGPSASPHARWRPSSPRERTPSIHQR